MSLKEIKQPLAEHLSATDKLIKESVKSPVPLLNSVTRYIIRTKGKQMRPLFVMLTAQLCGGINQSSYVGASLIELLHTATLVHDDVVDDSKQRRGFFSINAIYKNKISVLIGDYLLSRGLLLALNNKEYNLLHIVSEATKVMSEGELLQMQKSRSLDVNEETYFEIIRKKTASLIASCCSCGAESAGRDEETVKEMQKMGEHIGIAFQIKDDLLDIDKNAATGKPRGADLKEKKLTLPIIHMLDKMNNGERKKIIRAIKRHHDDKSRMTEIMEMVNKSDGISYAWEKMEEHKQAALSILEKHEDGKAKESLKKLIDFTITRRK